ncbi:MAG: hypothetical protein GW947_03460 [Candidatus Pacebacteria bacterium]|nr:hypothetical protein [Candidatus Paceibacterota bacterium]PIR59816.1 MAG: hypothetical protein COU68_03550 [Candidatus Pacebacteria bacterium CG10_big_fil_rev_8_21_14_0_10_45_6]
MIDAAKLTQLTDLIAQAKSIFVIFPATASPDNRAAAEALAASLSQAGKDIRLLSPRTPESSRYPESSEVAVTTELGNQNLVLSFSYEPEQVDNVNYHIGEETGRFYLTIKPQKGQKPLDPASVEFSYTGAEADLIFAVGVKELAELEQLYMSYEDVYSSVPIVSITNFEPQFATLAINAGSSPSLSQEVARLIADLGFTISQDAATQLLYGIEMVTQGLASRSVTAETFETVGQLLRQGARRIGFEQKSIEVTKEVKSAKNETTSIKKSMPIARG